MRGPKLVGGFHLPSAVCPPSVFGELSSDSVWQEPPALDGPGAQSFMTHNPYRRERNRPRPYDFRTTSERLPYGRSALSQRSLRREHGRTLSGPLRLPSAFAVGRGPPCLRDDALPRRQLCTFRDRRHWRRWQLASKSIQGLLSMTLWRSCGPTDARQVKICSRRTRQEPRVDRYMGVGSPPRRAKSSGLHQEELGAVGR